MTSKSETTKRGMKKSEDWLSYWDADKGLTKDGRTLLEFIEMIQCDAYLDGTAAGYAEGVAIP